MRVHWLVLVSLLAAFPDVRAAPIYRWMDDAGEYQFADRPPLKDPPEQYEEPAPPTVEERLREERLQRWRQWQEERAKLLEEERQETEQSTAELQARRAQCKEAQERHRYFSRRTYQVARQTADGRFVRSPDTERAGLAEHWRKEVERLCQEPEQ